MFKISGLNDLQKELEQASKAFKALDGEIAVLTFDAADQASVNAAISKMESAIDRKAGPYRNNRFVMDIVGSMKKAYRKDLLQRAAEARKVG
jgi:hypothetical protein